MEQSGLQWKGQKTRHQGPYMSVVCDGHISSMTLRKPLPLLGSHFLFIVSWCWDRGGNVLIIKAPFSISDPPQGLRGKERQ